MFNTRSKKVHPYLFIILSFVSVIVLGTILLWLPFTLPGYKSIGFVHALFQATSAVCVTGLSVETLSEFTLYGKIVMAILMEIGGLSFITIAVFFFTIIGGKIGISNRFLLKEALNQSSVKGVISLVKKIVIISFTIQVIITFVNWVPFHEYVVEYRPDVHGDTNQWATAFGISAFHADAAFNNAGFDIFGQSSMEIFASNADTTLSLASRLIINFSTIGAILLGGIGFVVYDDIMHHRRWSKLSLHTKIVLLTTLLLTALGTLLIKFSSDMPWLESLFAAVTTRTAGFATYNCANLIKYPIAFMLMLILMLIGASPCGTGGGVKTTTFAVVCIAIFNFARGKKSNKIFYRRISSDQVSKAFVLFSIALMIVLISTMVILAIQPHMGKELSFDEVLFEVVSAFSTTGLTMGITKDLCWVCDIVLCFVMLMGRLGPLTVMGILNKNWMTDANDEIDYVKENVIIG